MDSPSGRSHLGSFFIVFLSLVTCNHAAALGDNCASDEGAMCMANLQSLQLKDGGDVTKLSVPDLVQRCSDLRKNIACLLEHTQRCVPLDKRDQHAKVMLEARKYVAATCEADESVKAHWKDNKCYRQTSLQRCDKEFQDMMQHKPPAYPPTDNQCSHYYQFQSCVKRTVASCDDDSEAFVALYLLDYGARLAWLCPNVDESGRHQANVIQGSIPQDPLIPLGPDGSQQNNMNTKTALSGGSGSTCIKLIQNDMRRCYNRYQRQESELKKPQTTRGRQSNVVSDAQQIEAKPKICCAFGAYTHCLQTAVQTRCSQDREALVDTVISQTSKLIGGHCEEYYHGSPKCTAGGAAQYSWAMTTAVVSVCLSFLLVSNVVL